MDKESIVYLAEQKGLRLLESTMEINESGVDFRVVHAQDEKGTSWIIRVPRRPESMRGSVKEKSALDLLKNAVTFQVPDWSVYSEEMIAYRPLAGEPVAIIDPEKEAYVWSFDETNLPAGYLESLGRVLAELHTLPVQPWEDAGIDVARVTDLRNNMGRRMRRVKAAYNIHPTLWERWQTWLMDDAMWPDHVGVTHGDLHPGHILVNSDSLVTGLIDWTEVAVGDVSIDFLAHLLLFGETGLKQLLTAYENANGPTWPRMAEHIAELLTTSGITVAEYADVSGMQAMRDTAALMLAKENGVG